MNRSGKGGVEALLVVSWKKFKNGGRRWLKRCLRERFVK